MRRQSRLDPLGGTLLRYAICLVLKRRGRWMSVAEITEAISAMGFALPPNPNKAVGDAMRWEVRRGRVRKQGRSSYGYGGAPPTTEFRMRAAIATAQIELGVPGVAMPVGGNSLRGGLGEETEFDPESIWTTTADGARAIDLDAIEAYDVGRGRKTLSR